MTASYPPTSNPKGAVRSLAAATDNAGVDFITVARQTLAVALIGLGLTTTVAWVGVLGWLVSRLLLRVW
jgi:hypothetical protein